MYVGRIPNRSSPPTILLRESYREGGQVKSRTLANITRWPAAKIEALKRVLAGEPLVPPETSCEILRSLPHGHVAAVLGMLKRLGVDRLVAWKRTRERDLVVAMIVARIIEPCSKLATARGLGQQTAFTSLGEALEATWADEDELYAAMDWVLPKQARIEAKLARRHLGEGALVLYDVTSAYFEGTTCPLAQWGRPRGGKKGKLQIVIGLLCNAEGCPVAIEVFEGNTADPKTLASQVRKVRDRFEVKRVVWVGDRGMLTEKRLQEDLRQEEGLDWITALRAPAIRALAREGLVQRSLFDQRDLAEIRSPEYPGERLMVCRNPLLAQERRRKREDLLAATERELDKIVAAVGRKRRALRGQDRIGLRVGKVLNRFKVGKHFQMEIGDQSFVYERDTARIVEEAALDGIYVIRTSVPAEALNAEQTVCAYKGLSVAERAFRSLKTVDLKVRPIHHRKPNRVRAHVFLCMLAYYVEWHMRRSLAPLLFEDDDKPAGQALRDSVVAPSRRSPKADRKARTKRTEDGFPVHSFQTLLKDLATVTKNRVRFFGATQATVEMLTSPTALQQRAFDLLEVRLGM